MTSRSTRESRLSNRSATALGQEANPLKAQITNAHK